MSFDESCVSHMLSFELVLGTPRKLPKPKDVSGRVVVLDIAFAGIGSAGGFERITQPFIDGLADRLRLWVDHHDHREHARYAGDPRFVLSSKSRHPSCPEMITPELVQGTGDIDTVVCHNDFDGLASAAKWARGGTEPYPGCDADARAIDTRIGQPTTVADRLDRAIRARPRESGLLGLIVRHLASGLSDAGLWAPIDAAAAELIPIERETRRASSRYVTLPPGVALVDVSRGFRRIDKTLLLLIGQERAPVSVVVDRDTVTVAARFDSGVNFLELLQLPGGMPTRISLPRSELGRLLQALGADPANIELR